LVVRFGGEVTSLRVTVKSEKKIVKAVELRGDDRTRWRTPGRLGQVTELAPGVAGLIP
jgi:hypothetical protein